MLDITYDTESEHLIVTHTRTVNDFKVIREYYEDHGIYVPSAIQCNRIITSKLRDLMAKLRIEFSPEDTWIDPPSFNVTKDGVEECTTTTYSVSYDAVEDGKFLDTLDHMAQAVSQPCIEVSTELLLDKADQGAYKFPHLQAILKDPVSLRDLLRMNLNPQLCDSYITIFGSAEDLVKLRMFLNFEG